MHTTSSPVAQPLHERTISAYLHGLILFIRVWSWTIFEENRSRSLSLILTKVLWINYVKLTKELSITPLPRKEKRNEKKICPNSSSQMQSVDAPWEFIVLLICYSAVIHPLNTLHITCSKWKCAFNTAQNYVVNKSQYTDIYIAIRWVCQISAQNVFDIGFPKLIFL